MNTFYDIKNKKEILLQTIRNDNPNKSIPAADDLTELGYPKLHIVYEELGKYQKHEPIDIYQDESGNYIKKYIAVDITLTELKNILVPKFTSDIDEYIQSKINDYNNKHNLVFKDIDSINKYLINPNYKHYNFCREITLWLVDVWDKARELQEKMLTKEMDIIENIINFLPEFNFVEE